jgi:hypothetical protein
MSKPALQAEIQTDQSRLVARLSSDYFLRALRLMADLHDGELLTGIIFQAIIAANTAHLEQTGEGARHAGNDSVPPDDLRKPVSVLGVSGALGLPFETTRRHVNRLLASGRCKRVRGGVIVPQSTLQAPAMSSAASHNLANVKRFVREMKRAGVVLD